MKKLLALILCVMMFVSVIPTMAFAADADSAAVKAAQDEKTAAKAVLDSKNNAKPDDTALKEKKAETKAKDEAVTAAKKAVADAKSDAAKQQAEKDLYTAYAEADQARVDQKAAQAAYDSSVASYNDYLNAERNYKIAAANLDLVLANEALAKAKTTDANYSALVANQAGAQAYLNSLKNTPVNTIPTGTTPAGTTPAGTTPAAAAAATYDTSKAVAKNDPKLKADLENAAAYKKQVEKMIANTKKNVATAYGALAMNQVVYASAKSMDDVVGGLVDQIADMLAGKTVNGHKMSSADVKAFKDAHKASVRSVIEDIVISELEDNEYKYLDKDGKVDPLKYGQVVADAVNAALNNKDFQAGYQAVATYYAMMNVADSINEELKKQRDEFKDSIDMSFDKDFAGHYARLADEYIDTLTEVGAFDGNNDPWTAYITPEVGNWD
jgi:hypothetical protein